MEIALVDATVVIRLAAALVVVVLAGNVSHADSCTRSVEYLMNGLAGELPQPASAYRELLKICLQAASMSNVREAYVLKYGGIAVVPKRNSITATTETLARFCDAFPRSTLRFVTNREMRHGLTVGLVVMLPRAGSASCREINNR